MLILDVACETHPNLATVPQNDWVRALHHQASDAKRHAEALGCTIAELKRPLFHATEPTKSP